MEAIHYTLLPANPHAHLFEVTLRIERPALDGVRLRLPVWIPGSYLIREFARHIDSVSASVEIRVAGKGRQRRGITVTKVDKNAWLCDALPAATASPLTIHYTIYAWDLSVRAAHLDSSHGFFNGSSVFLAVAGREHEPCSVDILAPADARLRRWRVATTLPAAVGTKGAAPLGFGHYCASGYDELIDHPVELGNFELASFMTGGCRHEIAITGHANVDLARLVRDLKPIVREQIGLFDPVRRRAPVPRYLFLTMAVGDGYGGLEHRASTALICSRDDLPWPGMKGMPDGYRTFLGLASHEYFHTWNIKRIKPARFDPYDLDKESLTRLLWIFEGFTSYYDDLMLCRAGVIDTDAYLGCLQRAIRSVLAGPGRKLQSVAESSFDAWIKYYRQDENSPNAVVSYYVKGSLVALCLDLTIRARTRSARSLDDVMRLMWQRFGADGAAASIAASTGASTTGSTSASTGASGSDPNAPSSRGRGLSETDFPALVREATGLDLAGAIARWAYGTAELPIAECLAPFGIRWRLDADDARSASLGARTSFRHGEVHLQNAERDGPAARAGLSAGDRLLAIDGLRCDEAMLKTVLARRKPGAVIHVHAFRRDELIEAEVKLGSPPRQVTLISRGRNAARDAWLGARSSART